MKIVDIKTKIIPSNPRSKNYPIGYPGGIASNSNGVTPDLSIYLLKEIWERNFEERTDEYGNEYLYIRKPLAIGGGATMYASNGVVVPSIFDGLPLDNTTIRKNPETGLIEVIGGTGTSFDENAMWSALSGSSDNQINKSHLTNALAGYATESWVTGKGYATESWVASKNYATTEALNAVSNKLNDFLEGSDADTIINKWKELEAFLSGMAETDNLAEILETKADKKYVDSTFVTLATKQTITGEKTFSSVMNTAAIKASGEITTPSLAASDYVTIAGIKLRKLEDGALMLEGNLALTGALTMYASNGQSFDTIYDGLPIDNDTIYWQEVDGSRVLKAREGSGSSFDKSAMWTALAGSTTEQINKSHLTTALTGYATESWVSGKNYAVKATTLAGYGITDGINAVSVTGTGNAVTAASISGHSLTLTKGSTFSLSGHKHAWADITSGKPSTLSGYGITNAYTKTESDGKYLLKTSYTAADILAKLKTVDGAESDLEADILALTGETGSMTGSELPAHVGMQVFQYYQSGNGPTNYGNVLRIRGKGGGCGELFLEWVGNNNTGNIWYKSKRDTGLWGSWRQVAFTDMNVASATRLQTARTLWGQSFDGADNVSGDINNAKNVNATGVMSAMAFKGYKVRIECDDSGNRNERASEINNYQSHLYLQHNTSNNLLLCNGGGKVGIGTITPGYKLDVNGNAIIRSTLRISGQESSDIYTQHNNNGNITNISSDGLTGVRTSIVFQWYDTYWGIGNVRGGSIDSRGFAVYRDRTAAILINIGQTTIYGNLLVTGGVTLYGSDIRYKSIIQQVKLSLLEIANAPSFIYRWNKHGMNQNRLNLGGSAQYTQSVLPWAVNDNDNFLSMDYATVAYTFAVHTARHLLTYESRTDKKIKKLENRVKYLEKQLKKLGYEEVRTLDDSGI